MKNKKKSIIELMIPYYIEYNKYMLKIVSEANKLMIKPKELPSHDYKWLKKL